MMATLKKKTLKQAAAVLTLTLAVGCSGYSNSINPTSSGIDQNRAPTNTLQEGAAKGQQNTTADTSKSPSLPLNGSNTIVYKNTQYGFSFTLPDSWKGYSIITNQWEGLAERGQSGEMIIETGPVISIRDPQWTFKAPRQDIPIMVFTLNQWNSLQQGVFHIGAAPIGPSELGRNHSYVLALPARYNYTFLPGYKEVEEILARSPLQW